MIVSFNLRFLIILLGILVLYSPASHAQSGQWQHALVLFGQPKYPWYFKHFDYVNPKAPKGGELKLAHPATFDSLNQYILKGVKAPGLPMLNDSLMAASYDEPQSYYPLIAQAVRRDPGNQWIEFTLNPKARWHDDTPITPEDVIWTLQTMKEKADPTYRFTYAPLERAEKTGPRSVRIYFVQPATREAPLLAASMPILPSQYYQNVEFDKTTLKAPLGSGAYKIGQIVPGRTVVFQRVENYWGKDLPVNRGRFNFDRIRYDVYRDTTVALEALKGREYDFRQENVARNWATAYNIPAVRDGRMIKKEFPNALPQGMQGFYFNLRKPYLADRRVREAISLTLDYEWVNRTLFYGAYKRNTSFFQYTPFMANELPKADELKLLEPFRESLPSQMFEEVFTLPKTDGSGRDRKNLLRAQELLNEAGFKIRDGKRIDPATNEVMQIEFLLNQDTMERVIAPMRKGLKRLGIESSVRQVDDAQYQRRVETGDYDIISLWLNYGVIYPGVEQYNTWHSSQADVEGSNNVVGLKNKAVDDMINRIVNAHTLEQLTPAARALDRILLWEHIAIPHWHNNTYRVAFWDKFGIPEKTPAYSLAIETWWVK
jgi:microcin C transport system substrate-binding protein